MCQHIKIKCVFKWQVQPRGAVCVVTFPPLRTVERLVSGTYPAGSGSGRFIADWLWQVQCWLTVAGSVQINPGGLSADWCWQAVLIDCGMLGADWQWQAQYRLMMAGSVQVDNSNSMQTDPGRFSTDWPWQAQCRLIMAGSVQNDHGRLRTDRLGQVQCLFVYISVQTDMAGSVSIHNWTHFESGSTSLLVVLLWTPHLEFTPTRPQLQPYHLLKPNWKHFLQYFHPS